MVETDVAYIAGIVDGEGYVGIKKTGVRRGCVNPSYHARIQVRMVDEPAISFLAQTLGGSYYPEKPHSERGRPLFCYQASDAVAEGILRAALPYLRVKGDSARIVLALRDLQSTSKPDKVVGYRDFPNSYGAVRRVPNLAYSDAYIAECERLWIAAKEANHVGVR